MQIPGYEIIRKIGEGGSRTAYLTLREHCRDPTVVKVFKTNEIHERIADQRGRHSLQEILQAEVEVLRRFSHPNIIRIFNHGNVDHSFFIEEEYMASGTVEARNKFSQRGEEIGLHMTSTLSKEKQRFMTQT